MSDLLDEFLTEQVESIKEISELVSNLKRVGPGLGEFQFDKHAFDSKWVPVLVRFDKVCLSKSSLGLSVTLCQLEIWKLKLPKTETIQKLICNRCWLFPLFFHRHFIWLFCLSKTWMFLLIIICLHYFTYFLAFFCFVFAFEVFALGRIHLQRMLGFLFSCLLVIIILIFLLCWNKTGHVRNLLVCLHSLA